MTGRGRSGLKTHFWFFLSSLGLLLGGATDFGITLKAETLTLATYNIENYGAADRMTEAGFRKDYPKPETEKRALRTVLRGLGADVVVLQEMGDAAHLEELRRDLQTEGAVYPHAVLLEGADADRHVALLSKRPLKSITPHTDLTFTYFGKREKVKRGLLEVVLETDGGQLTLFAVHLKSRFTDRADDPLSALRRAGEAIAVRDRILQRFPAPAAGRFIVLGDCNDDKTSKALAHLQSRGKVTIADVLPAADSRGESWTHYYKKIEAYTHVDHVLVSPALRVAVVGGAARIYDGPGVDEASDHRPVVVTLDLKARK
jgi:endonuclease/exonuclease/phosphatase family metal-dependent hydrolase